jgi:hypothetical protein
MKRTISRLPARICKVIVRQPPSSTRPPLYHFVPHFQSRFYFQPSAAIFLLSPHGVGNNGSFAAIADPDEMVARLSRQQ